MFAPGDYGTQNVQDTSFHARVFHLYAPSSHSPAITTAYKKHEASKKREYTQYVCDVEHL